MKTISIHKNTFTRVALTLVVILTLSLTASATDFITDVMVAGHSNQTQFNTLIQNLQGQGWTDIDYDLNKGCGSSSYYIHLLYKKQSSSGNTGVPITDFYIRTGANPPDNLTYGGRTYYLVPCQGNDNFVNGHGDLNAGCGSSSDYIFLYYTKDALSNNTGVTSVTFNTTQSGAVGSNGGTTGYDLNHGAGGSYIYMHLSTATGANVVTLSSGSGNVPLRNGHILTGTGGTETQVTIADGATVTFNGVNNTAIPDNSSHPWPGISCLGNAVIVLNGSTTNSVKGGRGGSGIQVPQNKTLTIQGNGTLNATGGYRGAGIGGGWGSSCGNITISGGTITATGGDDSAGIGSGFSQSSCGNITISGGTVTATGGTSSAGIGSGYYQSSCGNITITNGVTRVTATKGQSSNNTVGAGNSSTCGTVTIGGVQTGNITMSSFVTYPYTVSFNANGGTGTMANQSFMYNVAQNLTANSFTRTNFIFNGWATSATGPKVYNDGQSVSNLTQTAGATVTLYAKWTADPAHLSVSGNEFTIHTATGWNLFCDLLAENSNGYFTGKTVKLGASFHVNRMAGSSGHEFSGIFDGQGNTLVVSYQNTISTIRTAPFSYVNGATIQNLVVTGSITGTAYCAAGIVGETGSNLSHVTNCLISANISGGQYTGGISIGGNVEITGCVFNGSINGTSKSGGFVGCSSNALVIRNCLFAPKEGSTINGGTFYYNGGGEITLVNSYYTTPLGTPQGIQAHSIAAGNYVTLTINDQVTATYSVSGINVTSVGVFYDNTYYAGEGNAVSLNLGCTSPWYYVFYGYQASAGTLTGTANPYTLTMPNEDVTIQAVLVLISESIDYIDGDNLTYTCTRYSVLTGNEKTLDAGWYVVDHDITYDTTLILNGDVTLILCNYTTMTVSPNSGIGIEGSQKSLTIYGQSLDSIDAGTLNVTNNDLQAAISLSNYIQHSGNVVANNSDGVALNSAHITMNGGTFITNGDSVAIHAEAMTVNGGKVETSGIFASDNITLGWTNTDDYIRSGSYNADGTVSVKNSQAFYYNENDVVVGTLDEYQVFAIGGKTLRPYRLATYTLTPTAYTLKNGGYTDIRCTLSSLELGGVWDENQGSWIEAWSLSFCMHGGMLTDSIGNSIPFLVDDGSHFGATTQMVQDVFSPGQGYTFIMTVYIDPDVYDAATPGTYTGEFVYDSYWNEDISIHGPSGSIALMLEVGVNYLDGNGQMYLCKDFTVLTGDETTLESGWYVVDHDITYGHPLTLAGDVNLILCDGKTMMVNPESGSGINRALSGDNEGLTLYGQSLDFIVAGTLNVTTNDNYETPIYVSTYTQHSGNVVVSNNANNYGANSYGLYSDHIIINGGSINAYGYWGIYADDGMTVNGGKVEATSIYASNNVTFGWTHTDDCILSGSYETHIGTVSVKSGQAFYYEEYGEHVIVSDTLNNDQIQAIGAKTLWPYLTPIDYIDGDSVMHTCTKYTPLTGNETTLEAGWYVVCDDITYDHTLVIGDSVNLILCNGITMTVSADNGEGIYGFSMTLYGQSLDPDVAGTLRVSDNNVDGIALALADCTMHSGNVVASSQYESAFGDGLLTVYGGSMNASGRKKGIISSLIVYGGSINASGEEGGNFSKLIVHGGSVYANGNEKGIMSTNVTIDGGTVTANGDDYGIYAVVMNINGGNIEANGSTSGIEINGVAMGIPTNDLTINGGTVFANGGDYGIRADASIIVNDGTVIVNGRDYGILADASIIVNDGTVTVTASNNFGNDESGDDESDKDESEGNALGRGIDASSDVIINGGIVTVSATTNGYYVEGGGGIHANGDVIFNDGIVTSNSNYDGIHAGSNVIMNGIKMDVSSIFAENNITLGWTNTDDYIRSGSYNADGTVSVKRGQAFYYEDDVIVSGTLNEDQVDDIQNKTLRPYIVPITVTKDIAGYGTGNGGWHLIALPLYGTLNPATMIADTAAHYDLYRFNPSHEGNEWENYKSDSTFKLEIGKGYLYANKNDVNLVFSGPAHIGDTCEVALSYDANDSRKCWNLVGNPFPSEAILDREYYVLNNNSLEINPVAIPADIPIPPCTAVFVKAVVVGDVAVFTKVMR